MQHQRSSWMPSQRRSGAWRWGAALAVGVGLAVLAGCASQPKGRTDTIVPVTGFDVNKYMGQWHEIVRIDHRFQKGVVQSTAHYTLNDDGTVKVINRGYDPKARRWKEAEAKAKFTGDPTVAALKVSFFGPFYSGYNVVDLDPDYRVAMVVGEDTRYFWILAREPQVPEATMKRLLDKAQAMGVDVSQVKAYR